MGSPLPAELLCNVAEDLADDTLSLRCLAQTCQLALNPCRQVLFRHIKLIDGVKLAVGVEAPCDRLHAIIEANPHIATFIHSLDIWSRAPDTNCVPWSKTLTSVLHRIANGGHLRILSIFAMANMSPRWLPPTNGWDTCGDELQAAFLAVLQQSSFLQTIRLNCFCDAETGIKLLSAVATSAPIVDVGLIYFDPREDAEDDFTGDDDENGMDDNNLGSRSSTYSHNDEDDFIASDGLRHLKTLKIGPSSETLVDWILSPPSKMSVTKLKTLIMDGPEPACRGSAAKIFPICADTIERLAWLYPLMEDIECYSLTGTGINLRRLHRVREMTVYFDQFFIDHIYGALEGSGLPPNLEHLNFVVGFPNERDVEWDLFDWILSDLIKPLRSFESIRITFVDPPPRYLEDDIGITTRLHFEKLHSTGKLVAEVVETGQRHMDLLDSRVKASISYHGTWKNDISTIRGV